MTIRKSEKLFLLCLLLLGNLVFAQSPGMDRLTIPLSDPARPVTLKAGLMNGGITVTGYAGKEVLVEARVRTEADEEERQRHNQKNKEKDKALGMRRLEITATGLTVEEENNVVEISTSSMNRTVDLNIQVPQRASLELSCLNDGDIKVDNLTGEFEINNTNGGVTLTNISGAVVAHALNENVVVTFTKVEPDKSMSFTSLNGDIDVTFPPDVRAKVKLKSDNGEIYSDFDVRLEPSTVKTEEDGRKKGGKYRIQLEKTMIGMINGGGPEMQFATFNGDIYIRKRKP
ncbi:MAG: DUF4097 family beta strand repeat-containing protein [bacterium]